MTLTSVCAMARARHDPRRARTGGRPVLLAALLCLVDAAMHQACAQGVPAVTLKPSPVPFDLMCEELTRHRHQATGRGPAWKIDPEWSKDLAARLPEFQAHWDAEASDLVGTALAVAGRPFPHREMIATASLCAVISMSNPLVLNMRRFLPGPTGGKPQDKVLFAALVFHELLHTYVAAHRPPVTPLLLEHQAVFERSLIARNHVHLFALMQVVYGRLGRAEDLQRVIASDRSGPDPDYGLAWDLVDRIGADRLVAELKGP